MDDMQDQGINGIKEENLKLPMHIHFHSTKNDGIKLSIHKRRIEIEDFLLDPDQRVIELWVYTL